MLREDPTRDPLGVSTGPNALETEAPMRLPVAEGSEPAPPTAEQQVRELLEDVRTELRALRRAHVRRTFFLDQRSRVLAGDNRVLSVQGGGGELVECSLVSPVNAYLVSLLVDDVPLLDEVSFADLLTTGPRVANVDAEERPDGTFVIILTGLKFTRSVEVFVHLKSQQTFTVIFATVELDEEARLTPAPGLQG